MSHTHADVVPHMREISLSSTIEKQLCTIRPKQVDLVLICCFTTVLNHIYNFICANGWNSEVCGKKCRSGPRLVGPFIRMGANFAFQYSCRFLIIIAHVLYFSSNLCVPWLSPSFCGLKKKSDVMQYIVWRASKRDTGRHGSLCWSVRVSDQPFFWVTVQSKTGSEASCLLRRAWVLKHTLILFIHTHTHTLVSLHHYLSFKRDDSIMWIHLFLYLLLTLFMLMTATKLSLEKKLLFPHTVWYFYFF